MSESSKQVSDIALVARRQPDLDQGHLDYHVYAGSQLVGRIYEIAPGHWKWAIKSVMHQGRDITDVPLVLKSGEVLSNVLVTVTNSLSVIDGELTDAKDRPTGDGTVIVFVDDASKWMEDSRFVASARPDAGGHWVVEGLPPGKYLAVAVDCLEEGQWHDPKCLESMRPSAQMLTLVDEESKSVRLRLSPRSQRKAGTSWSK